MFGMETWMDFEQALQSDESMQSSFQTVVENLIRSGVQDERELLGNYGGADDEALEALTESDAADEAQETPASAWADDWEDGADD